MMKLTIILTVYNKEAYVRRMLDSLLYQRNVSALDYEVLIVNDGSIDGSAAILNEYSQRFSAVRILTQTNQGLSIARNNGVKEARGEYVWFVDADDTVSCDAVNLICEAIETNPDVIPIYAQTAGSEEIRNEIPPSASTGKEVLLSGKWQQCGVFWAIRRSFLDDNHLKFMAGVYHEDAEFTPKMLYFAKRVKVVTKVLYTVFRDPNGITQIFRSKRAFDYLLVAESLSHFVVTQCETRTAVGRIIDDSVALCVNNAMYIISHNAVDEQKSFNAFFYSKRVDLLRSFLNSSRVKYRLEAFILLLFPRHSVPVYKTLKCLS